MVQCRSYPTLNDMRINSVQKMQKKERLLNVVPVTLFPAHLEVTMKLIFSCLLEKKVEKYMRVSTPTVPQKTNSYSLPIRERTFLIFV